MVSSVDQLPIWSKWTWFTNIAQVASVLTGILWMTSVAKVTGKSWQLKSANPPTFASSPTWKCHVCILNRLKEDTSRKAAEGQETSQGS
jgi:hypothetical protein